MNMTTEPEITEKGTRSVSIDAFQEMLTGLEQPDQERLQWLWGFFHGPLARNKAALSTEMGAPWEDIRAMFSGLLCRKQLPEMFDAIDALRRRTSKQKPLVHTVVVERMIETLNYTRDYSAMTYITGPTGRGKTYTAEAWAVANNHGRSKYIRIPSDCTRRGLLMQLSKVCGCACKGNSAEMEANLCRVLGPRNVLIVDEAGHLLPRSGQPGGPIELFRDLHDICKCGVCLIFTDVYLSEIKRGANADYFEQFLGRFEFQTEIPKQPRRDEVRQVLQAFMPDAPEDAVSYALALTAARDGKLRTLFKDLYRAEQAATHEGHRMTKKDLKDVADWRKSTGAWPEDK